MSFKTGDFVQYRTPGVVRYSTAIRYIVTAVADDGYVIIREPWTNGKEWRCSPWRLERVNC